MIEVMNMNLPLNSSVSLNSLALINCGRSASMKQKRRRGLVLTEQGWQKLMQAGVICDRYGNRNTYEFLAGQSALSPSTVSKIINCMPVDKQTLKVFFDAFHLQLELADYTTNKFTETEHTSGFIEQHRFNNYAIELSSLLEEVAQLKERLEYIRQRSRLLGLTELTSDEIF
jgi:hypothetical protein